MTPQRSSSLALLVLGAAFAGMLAWTWLRWPDVQIDFGREVYGAWRLASGDVLQRDVAWLQGPLSVHWNALVLSVFGTSLLTLFVANLLFTGVVAVVLWFLLREIGGDFAATVGVLTFVLVFACCQLGGVGNDNWIAPYSHELTHGVGFGLACLLAAVRGRVGLAAFLFGLVLLTKPEPALATGVALALVGLRERRFTWRWFVALVPPALACVALAPALGLGGALHAVAAPFVHALELDASASPYYRALLGIDALGANLARIALHAFAWLLVAAVVGALVRRGRVRSASGLERVAVFGVALLGAVLLPIPWLEVLVVLPVALSVVAAFAWRAPSVASLGLSAFAFVLLGKLVLDVSARHYGFALAMPGTALVVALVLAPRALAGWGPSLRAFALALVVAWTGAHLAEAARWRAIKTVRVGVGADSLLADDRGVVANQALSHIVRTTRGPIAVVPEGALLNYLTRRESPTPYVNFMPPEVELWGDERIAAALEAARVRHVVHWSKDMSEYGVRAFGDDFAPAIGRWLAGYEPRLTLGDPGRAYPGRVVRLLEATGLIENVVLVSIDTLRADRVGTERGLTPTLDALAAEGVSFAGAYAAAPWTLPSHAALFASTWPHATGTGTYQEPGRLADELETLAERLGGAGFETAAFTGGGYLSAEFGLAQGFETFVGDLGRASMRDVVDRAHTWLAARRDERPFFLFLHTWEVHQYDPPEPFRSRFVTPYDGPLQDVDSLPLFLQQHRWLADPGALTEDDLRYATELYDATVASTDFQLGRLVAELRRRNLLANTLVVVTSDHGEEFLEHGGTGHGYTLFEENVRVPLIFWHPTLPSEGNGEPVSLVDLAPTIAARVGVSPAAAWRGVDLFAQRAARDVFLGSAHRPFVGAVRGAQKLVVSLDRPPPLRTFDLAKDPGEVSPQARPSHSLLDSLLDRYLVDARAPGDAEIDAALAADLARLGYAGEAPAPSNVPSIDAYRALVRRLLR
ncbi:MAG: sulfatase-like hydrolase/transferase [Planctomycetota bacterium]